MTSAMPSPSGKSARGTKRTCQECQVRFYDLSREPIVCPSCGAQHAAMAQPVIEAGDRRLAPASGKTGWRRSAKPSPVAPVADQESGDAPLAAATEELEGASEDVPGPAPEDDIVLDPESDEADVSGLVDVDVEDTKERG
jgi:uncharacterized protein (TIGR02300 family)